MVGPQPLQSGFERAHHSIAAVIERRFVAGYGEAFLPRLAGLVLMDPAPDLGGDTDGVAAHALESRTQAGFAQAITVIRRRIEVADAFFKRSVYRPHRLTVGHLGVKIADRRRAEARNGQPDPGAAQTAFRDFVDGRHGSPYYPKDRSCSGKNFSRNRYPGMAFPPRESKQ